MQRKKLGTSSPTLSPEVAAFLSAADPKPAATQRSALTLAPAPSESTLDTIEASTEPKSEATRVQVEEERPPKSEREKKEKRPVVKESVEIPEVLVADSFKLPQKLHRRLLRASSERKLDRLKPYTKQDLVAIALDEWLSRHGYPEEK